MRIAIGQFDTTVGAFERNVDRIVALAGEASRAGASLLLLPEQTLPGYPARDFLSRPAFVARGVRALDDLAARTRHEPIAIVVGHALPHVGQGAGLYNAAVVLHRGAQVAVARKRLLPNYDVFDEARYFDPGDAACVFEWEGVRLGLTICEDLWSEPLAGARRRHAGDPAGDAVEAGAQVILNIAASPYEGGKERVRERILGGCAARHRVPIAYCNLVGGNDSLIFDGRSFSMGPDGAILASAQPFAEDLLVVEVEPAAAGGAGAAAGRVEGGGTPANGAGTIASGGPTRGALRQQLTATMAARPSGERDGATREEDRVFDCDGVLDALTLGLADYARKSGLRRAVLGLSGGIDSALTAVIAVRALGPGNVLGVAMPSMFTAGISNEDADELARNLGIRIEHLPIERTFEAFQQTLAPALPRGPATLTLENLQARARGVLLMALSNEQGALLLTTGNKSELAVGYCTLYGDMAGGLAVLGDVLKTEVYRLARYLNRDGIVIPERTIERPPSAELRADQTDQDSLPPYDVLDRILHAYLVERLPAETIAARGDDEAVVRRVIDLVIRSEFKRRQAAPVLKVSPTAFGEGWRYPICHGFA